MFFFFVGGVGQQVKQVLKSGVGRCIACGSSADLVDSEKVLKLFFVPVWRWSGDKQLLHCNNCNLFFPESFSPPPPRRSTAAEEALNCRFCGRDVQADFRFCPFCGGSMSADTKMKPSFPKRDMAYEEKCKLGNDLQSLPPEKLDSIVHIIEKSNTGLCQHDGDIEVDIDYLDAETLWELDSFVTNYKRSLQIAQS